MVFPDGKMWATSTGEVADMPSQRAFLSWQNGIETLIVESDFSGKAGDYTWLIPVPSKPARIEALEPGALETLQTLMPIRLAEADGALTMFLVLSAIVAATALHGRSKVHSAAAWSWQLLVATAILMFLMIMLLPVYAGGGETAKSSSEVVGSYDVSILQARSSELSTDIPKDLPTELRPTLDRLLAQGWSVVVARLEQTKAGLASPHPLLIQFRSQAPIYPMRLTGVGEDRLHLDLFVQGPSPAHYPDLHRFASRQIYGDRKSGEWTPSGHPDLTPLFQQGQWLTRMSGVLRSAEMDEDLVLSWDRDAAPMHLDMRAIDSRSAPWIAMQWILGVSAVAMILLGGLGFKKPAWAGWKRPVLWSFALGGVVAAWQIVPVPRYERGSGRSGDANRNAAIVERAVEYAKAGRTADESEAIFFRKLKVIGGSRAPRRAVPGGFMLKHVGHKVEIAVYDKLAKRTVYTLPEDP